MEMKNKKGQLFTLIAIALLFLFLVSYEIYSTLNERKAIKTRVKTMDSFLFSIEENLERQLYISGFRTIFLAENEVAKTGEYISNFSQTFQEAVYNGTYKGNKSTILAGITISEIKQDIQEKADKINLLLNLSNISIKARQLDPWHISIILNATLNLTDKSNLASWNKNEFIVSKISIENFEDPFYIVNTNGKITRKINKTIYKGNYVSDSDVSNLSLHLENKNYAANPLAPSFLYRLQGIISPNENGIESFVYIPELSSQDIPTQEKSVIDYIYFSSSNPDSSLVSGLPEWFRIDSEHEDKYQIP